MATDPFPIMVGAAKPEFCAVLDIYCNFEQKNFSEFYFTVIYWMENLHRSWESQISIKKLEGF